MALLQRSTSAAQRMQVLECLQRETPDTRAKLANAALCLGALEEWVLDLIEDRMSFHVLETLLKVRLTDAVWLQGVPGIACVHTTSQTYHFIDQLANAVSLAAV